MYQFALDSYVVLFLISIAKSPKSDNIEERLKNLNEYHTYAGWWLGGHICILSEVATVHTCMCAHLHLFVYNPHTYVFTRLHLNQQSILRVIKHTHSLPKYLQRAF